MSILTMIDKKSTIRALIYQFLEAPLPKNLPRHIDFSFSHVDFIRKVYTVMGPRRAGKSYFCFQVMNQLYASGVDKKNMLYFSLENDELFPLELTDLNTILEVYFEITGKMDETVYFFLDEIQEIPDFAKFIRKVLDQYPKIQLVITGSSSRMLSREIDTVLRGRSVAIEVLPLSYVEYLDWNHLTTIQTRDDHLRQKNLDFKMLQSGLFPEIVIETNEIYRKKYLQNYFDLILYRDVIERYQIKSLKKVKILRKLLVSSMTKLISINALAQTVQVEHNTLSNWIDAFTDAYMFFELKCFSFSVKQQEKSQSKMYMVDSGWYPLIFSAYSENYGAIFENIVFLEFRKQGFRENENIFYFQDTAFDIDFILLRDQKIIPVQVSYQIHPQNIDREITQFDRFLQKY